MSGFVNLDYRWRPGVDVVWDLMRPLPFTNERFEGVFSEHCLEHFELKQLSQVLGETYRVLKPSGILRIVIPGLAKYVISYSEKQAGIINSDSERLGTAKAFNRVFYSGYNWMSRSHWWNDGHHFIHDFESISEALKGVGFNSVKECSLLQGDIPELLIDREDRAWESLYVEARK